MEADESGKKLALVFSKLAVELRILSDLGYRLEYAISDHFAGCDRKGLSSDLQILDLLIQSADALERLVENLAEQSRSGGLADLNTAAADLVLRDMISRLNGAILPPAVPGKPPPESGLELL